MFRLVKAGEAPCLGCAEELRQAASATLLDIWAWPSAILRIDFEKREVDRGRVFLYIETRDEQEPDRIERDGAALVVAMVEPLARWVRRL